jgi:hypothetical protein
MIEMEDLRDTYARFGVDVTNIDASFVVEEDLVAFPRRADGDVVLVGRLVLAEHLGNEVVEDALDPVDRNLSISQIHSVHHEMLNNKIDSTYYMASRAVNLANISNI